MNSSTDLHSILNDIETKLNYRTNSKMMESKIKADLNFFKESKQKLIESKLINENFLPDFGLNIDPKKPMINPNANSSLNHSAEFEMRKIIEREIEPYLFSIKNELRVMIDNFAKDMGDYNYVKPEINIVKETVLENKRLVIMFQEDFDKKFSEYTQKFHVINKQFDDVKVNFGEFTKKVRNFEKIYDSIQEKVFMIDSVKEKLSNIESNADQHYQKIENNISLSLSSKFKSIEASLDSLKGSNNTLSSNMSTLSMNLSSMESISQESIRNVGRVTEGLAEIKEKVENASFKCSTMISKTENVSSGLNALNDKFINLSKDSSAMEENMNNLELNMKEMSDEVNQNSMEIKEIKRKCEMMANSNSSLKNEIANINSAQKGQNEKLLKLPDPDQIYEQKFLDFSQKLEQDNAKLNDRLTKLTEDITRKFEDLKKEKISSSKTSSEISNQNLLQLSEEIQKLKNDQVKVNELFEASLSEMVKQTAKMNMEMSNLKNDFSNYEDNFESIENNFIKIKSTMEKIPGIETQQNLFKEIITTLSVNENNLKQSVEKTFSSLTSWQTGLIDNLTQKLNELKSEVELKINTSIKENEKIYAQLGSGHSPKSGISVNTAFLQKKIQELEERVNEYQKQIPTVEEKEKYVEKVLFNKILKQKFTDVEGKIAEVFHYFEPKLDEIVEYIKVLSMKCDMNNPNNVTNSNIFQSNPLNHVPLSHVESDIHPRLHCLLAGYINNLNYDYVLQGNDNQIHEFKFDRNAPRPDFYFKTEKNRIDEKCLKIPNYKKFQSNLRYLSLTPVTLNENKAEFPGYLKKYLVPKKNYESILEIEFEYNQDNFNSDDPEDFLQNRLSQSGGVRVHSNEELQALDENFDDIESSEEDDNEDLFKPAGVVLNKNFLNNLNKKK